MRGYDSGYYRGACKTNILSLQVGKRTTNVINVFSSLRDARKADVFSLGRTPTNQLHSRVFPFRMEESDRSARILYPHIFYLL